MSRLISLTQGFFALVDDDDYEALSKFKWNASPTHSGTFYAARGAKKNNGKYATVLMHRIINKTPKGILTDHINGDTLDNQKTNLRNVTYQQNRQNSKSKRGGYSKYKGVTWHKRDKCWTTKIVVNGEIINLGNFQNEEMASDAYNKAADQYFGEYARTTKGTSL